MLAVLKLLVIIIALVLIVSALCGVVAFFLDIHRFKGENNMSLPRAKLIQKIIEENELKRQKLAEAEEKEEEKEKKENEENQEKGGEQYVQF